MKMNFKLGMALHWTSALLIRALLVMANQRTLDQESNGMGRVEPPNLVRVVVERPSRRPKSFIHLLRPSQ